MPSFLKVKLNPWLILVMGAMVGFIGNGVRMSYGVFVVPLEQAFELTRWQAVLPFSVGMVIWGVAQPLTGAFMDAKGPRKAILVAVTVSALGLAVAAGAQNLWQLVLGYGLLVGGAYSGMTVAAFSLLVNRWFPKQRGRAIGFVLAGMPVGSLVFSPLAAAVIANWDWRAAFLGLAAIMLLVALPLSWFFLQEPTRLASTSSVTSSEGGLFFNSEIRQAIKTQAYWMLMLKYFGCGFSGLFVTAHLPAMALEHGFSPQEGATALGLIGAGGAVGALLGGWASDRFGRYKTLAVGYFMRGVGLFLLAFFVSDITSFYVISVIAGMPIFFTIAITQLVIYEIFGAGIAGRMIGLTFLLHQVGATMGPYFGGRMFEATGGYTVALVIAAGVLFNSAFLGWRLQGAAQRYIATRADS